MDKASASGAGDSRFESWAGHSADGIAKKAGWRGRRRGERGGWMGWGEGWNGEPGRSGTLRFLKIAGSISAGGVQLLRNHSLIFFACGARVPARGTCDVRVCVCVCVWVCACAWLDFERGCPRIRQSTPQPGCASCAPSNPSRCPSSFRCVFLCGAQSFSPPGWQGFPGS